MVRALVFLSLFLAVAGFAMEAHAKKSIWAILFPYHVKSEEDPAMTTDLTETKQAPFADPSAESKSLEGPLGELYDATGDPEGVGGDPMERPHRHQNQIASWLLKAVSDIFAVDPGAYEKHLQNLARIVDQKGLADIDKFMRESRTLETLANNNMVMTAFVEEDPILLNKAPLGGRYRWLFEMPVTLSFLPEGVSSYDNVEPISHSVLLRVQVGRIKPVEGQEDIIIESFDVRRNSEE